MQLFSEFLRNVSFCQDLNEAARSKLAELLISKKISAGAVIFREFDDSDCLYIVKSGRIIISKHVQDQVDIVLTRFHTGDFFGEMTLIEMQNRSATVVAESPTVLYELTARNLYAYYKADIHAYVMVMLNINRELCRRLRRADIRIAELADASRESMTQNRLRPVG